MDTAFNTLCSNPGGFGEQSYSDGSRTQMLIRIRAYAGSALLCSGLRWSLDELLLFWRLSNHDLLSEMKNALSSSSVQFSRSVVSDSFRPHGLQHTRPPCPSPIPRVYSNSYPLSW